MHHVQQLHLHVGRQRQHGAAHVQLRGQSGLMLELLQRGAQGCRQLGAVAAGAEVQQQLAHVGQALAHAGVEFVDHARGGRRIAAAQGSAQHLQLNLHEGQRLRDGVVQFPGDEAALLGNSGLALQGLDTHTFDAAGQLGGQALQQGAVVVEHGARGVAPQQVHFAQGLVLQQHGQGQYSLEAEAPASSVAVALFQRMDGDGAVASRAGSSSAAAVPGCQATFVFEHGSGHPVRCQHQHAALFGVVPAQQGCVGPGHLAKLAHETLRQIV